MITFNVKPFQRFLLFCCLAVVGMIITGVVSQFVLGSGITATKLNIVTVVQDVMLFIVPDVLTAVIVCRQPAEFLQINSKPTWICMLLVLCLLLGAVPLMNVIINWNSHLHLPESMAAFEAWARQAEESANEMLGNMMGEATVLGLIVSVLTMGIMAGLAEELFFRGGIQRLMITARVNKHVAVWTTAILFSAIHFQFFGFVPRMLLGALFGYLCVWSGSLWYSVIAHCANNIMACVTMWLANRGVIADNINEFGADTSSLYQVWSVIFSIVITVMFLRTIYRWMSFQKPNAAKSAAKRCDCEEKNV